MTSFGRGGYGCGKSITLHKYPSTVYVYFSQQKINNLRLCLPKNCFQTHQSSGASRSTFSPFGSCYRICLYADSIYWIKINRDQNSFSVPTVDSAQAYADNMRIVMEVQLNHRNQIFSALGKHFFFLWTFSGANSQQTINSAWNVNVQINCWL